MEVGQDGLILPFGAMKSGPRRAQFGVLVGLPGPGLGDPLGAAGSLGIVVLPQVFQGVSRVRRPGRQDRRLDQVA